jgi:predicted  nucleic acid-binding Zn-ribbon protein
LEEQAMRVRHRVPSIFNLSIVDVLCCALGCVLLLWLFHRLQARELETQSAENQRKSEAKLASIEGLLKTTESERDTARKSAGDLDVRLKALLAEKMTLDDELRSALAKIKDFAGKLKVADDRVTKIEGDYRQLEKKRDNEVDRADSLARQLATTLAKLKDAQTLADLVPDLRTDLKTARDNLTKRQVDLDDLKKLLLAAKSDRDTLQRAIDDQTRSYKDKLKTADDKSRDLESTLALIRDKLKVSDDKALDLLKKMVEKETALTDAQRTIRTLRNDIGAIRTAAENRFAGIALTGKRVVFMVDMSGSMGYIAEKEEAPEKWPGVRDTVLKLMKSLPELEKFQLIVFSDKARYLLGSDGRWIDYDSKTTPAKVSKALTDLQPKGGTDMYAPMEMAFRLRASGLDTIYLLSDGLPNMGTGVDPDKARTMSEQQLGELLGKHILKTLRTDWNRPLRDVPKVKINAVGFFYESPDVGAFLWALARANEGSFVGMSKP